jgi:hypothetical protein
VSAWLESKSEKMDEKYDYDPVTFQPIPIKD